MVCGHGIRFFQLDDYLVPWAAFLTVCPCSLFNDFLLELAPLRLDSVLNFSNFFLEGKRGVLI